MGLLGKKKVEVVEPPITLSADSKSAAENQQREIACRQSEAIVPTKELLYDALLKRADRIMLDYSKESVAGRYMIDGVWHNIEPRDRVTGDGSRWWMVEAVFGTGSRMARFSGRIGKAGICWLLSLVTRQPTTWPISGARTSPTWSPGTGGLIFNWHWRNWELN